MATTTINASATLATAESIVMSKAVSVVKGLMTKTVTKLFNQYSRQIAMGQSINYVRLGINKCMTTQILHMEVVSKSRKTNACALYGCPL